MLAITVQRLLFRCFPKIKPARCEAILGTEPWTIEKVVKCTRYISYHITLTGGLQATLQAFQLLTGANASTPTSSTYSSLLQLATIQVQHLLERLDEIITEEGNLVIPLSGVMRALGYHTGCPAAVEVNSRALFPLLCANCAFLSAAPRTSPYADCQG